MMVIRHCDAVNEKGEPCRQAPLVDSAFCFWHDPEHAEEAAEARKLGGRRRRRDGTISIAYDFEGVESVEQIRRVLDIAILDLLGLDVSVSRSRTLISAALAAAKLLEIGKLVERMESLEALLRPRLVKPAKANLRRGGRQWTP